MNHTSNTAGILYGVGVGPGDPELLTLKALHTMEACDYIAVPSEHLDTCVAYQIARQAFPGIQDKHILSISMPMTKDAALLAQSHEAGARSLENILNTGASIAFLTLGDPTVYSTYLYLHQLVGSHGYITKMISGIPSFCAASAALNMGLVAQAEPLHIYPGSYPIEESLSLSGTIVYMKSGRSLDKVKKALESTHNSISMVSNCGMSEEHIYPTLADIPDESSYYSLIISKEQSL